MAPDRASIDAMLRDVAPDALKYLYDVVQHGCMGAPPEAATVRVQAAEALLRCVASFPDPYAAPITIRREVSR